MALAVNDDIARQHLMIASRSVVTHIPTTDKPTPRATHIASCMHEIKRGILKPALERDSYWHAQLPNPHKPHIYARLDWLNRFRVNIQGLRAKPT